MQASFAALLYTLLILWLLYRDQRTSRGSAALWLVVAWVAIIGSKPVVYWVNGNSVELQMEDVLDGNALDRNILLGLLFSALAVLASRRLPWRSIVASNWTLLVFYTYLALSITWSEYPFVAFKRYIKDVGSIAMLLVVLTDQAPVEALRRVLLRCAYILIPLSVLFIKYYPEIGRYYHRWTYEAMYGGVTTNKNSLGVLAMVSGLALLWSLLEARGKRTLPTFRLGEMLVFVMCLWLLNIADSATSLGCFCVGVLTLFGARLSWTKANVTRLTWSLFVALSFSALILSNPVMRGFVAERVGRDATLTTRTDIWEAAVALGTNVWVGAGYASVWLTSEGRRLAQELRIPHAHNGYLETYLNTGVTGLALLLILIASTGRKVAKDLSSDTEAGPLLITLFVTAVIYNYTEVTFNVDSIMNFCLLLTALNCNRKLAGVDRAEETRLARRWQPAATSWRRMTPMRIAEPTARSQVTFRGAGFKPASHGARGKG